MKINKPVPKKSRKTTHRANPLFDWDIKLCLVVLRVAIDLNCSFKSSEQASLLPRHMVLQYRWCQKGCQSPLLLSYRLWAIGFTSSFLLFSGPWAGQAFQPAQLAQHCSATFPDFLSLLFLQQEYHPLFITKCLWIFVGGYGPGVGQVLAARVVSVRKQGCPMPDTATSRQLQQMGNGWAPPVTPVAPLGKHLRKSKTTKYQWKREEWGQKSGEYHCEQQGRKRRRGWRCCRCWSKDFPVVHEKWLQISAVWPMGDSQQSRWVLSEGTEQSITDDFEIVCLNHR